MKKRIKRNKSKGTFYFEKVKMIGRLRYKIIRTEVSNNEERLEISQKIHRFLRKEKEKPFGDKIIRNRFNGIKNKNGFLGYIVCSAIWGNVSDEYNRCSMAFIDSSLFLYRLWKGFKFKNEKWTEF